MTLTAATFSKSAIGSPVNNWQLRNVVTMAAFLNSTDFRDIVSIINLIFPPKVNPPVWSGATLDSRGKTFTAQLFNKRRWQKGRNNKQPFVGFELVHALADFRQWLDATTNQVAH